MFLDASALVAVIVDEAEADDFVEQIEADADPVTSGIAIYEATLAIARISGGSIHAAKTSLHAFLASADIRLAGIGWAEADAALDAHVRFGKGRHPARLNMGDCFAYACARTNGAPLLFKGDDFTLTDIEPA